MCNAKDYVMRRILLIAAVLAACLCLFYSCASRAKLVKEEQTTDTHKSENVFEKDSTVIEYLVDTTRLTDTEVVFTRTDFYPYFVIDTATAVSRQPVKTVARALVRKKEVRKGETRAEATAVSTRSDCLASDSASVVRSETAKTTSTSPPWWWLLVALLLVGFGWWFTRNR